MIARTFLAFLLATGAAAAGQAQQAQPPQEQAPSQEIVVEGARNQDREIGAFVDALTDARIGGQLSRFDWAVCPVAVGLSDAQNAAITARMRKVAEAAGMKRAAEGCRPNAFVIVTRNKGELIARLHKAFPAYFSGITRDQVGSLIRQPGPAAAWQIEGEVDKDGVPLSKDLINGYSIVERTDAPSRISPSSRPHFAASVVVVEIGALAGLTTTQLADYAAMRTFARTDPSRLERSAAPTILTVLEAPMDSAVPVTLTEWDLGFLKALYASEPNRYASQQRGDINTRLRRELQGRD